jgi:hypothetical protein
MKYLMNFIMMNESIEGYSIDKRMDSDDFLVNYEFTDLNDNRYLVQFKNDTVGPKSNPVLGKCYELTYYVWDEEINNWNVNKLVNTNLYKVLVTVFGTILNDFIKRKPWVTRIRFEGLAKEQEREYVTQRTKAYLRHLRNNPVPNFSVENFGNNRITLIKNKI